MQGHNWHFFNEWKFFNEKNGDFSFETETHLIYYEHNSYDQFGRFLTKY